MNENQIIALTVGEIRDAFACFNSMMDEDCGYSVLSKIRNGEKYMGMSEKILAALDESAPSNSIGECAVCGKQDIGILENNIFTCYGCKTPIEKEEFYFSGLTFQDMNYFIERILEAKEISVTFDSLWETVVTINKKEGKNEQ